MKNKKIIIVSVLVAIIAAAAVVWFEIPRIQIRNYIKANLPEGHYTIYPNSGDFITSNTARNQSTDRIWHVYDKDRNVHFNIFQLDREENIETPHSTRNRQADLYDNFRSNFVGRYWSSLIYDNENKYETKLKVEFVPDDRDHFEWRSGYEISGYFADRKELDALFDDLYVPTLFFEEKKVPLSYGFFEFQYTNCTHLESVGDYDYSYLMYGTLDDIEAARTEAYCKMIDIGMKYNDDDILAQFTQQELDAYVPFTERVGNSIEE